MVLNSGILGVFNKKEKLKLGEAEWVA